MMLRSPATSVRPFQVLLLSAFLAAPLKADWSVFVPQGAALGDLWTLDQNGGSPLPEPGLQDIELLDLDHVGRTRLERFLPDRPRRELLAGGGARLVLPAGQGSLYAYRRTIPLIGVTFGLIRIQPNGLPQTLLVLPGTGPAGDQNPLLPFIACDPAATSILVATKLSTGGNLYEIDLALGTQHVRSAALAPQEWLPQSLGLRAGFGVAMSSTGPVRFARTVNAQASFVPIAGAAPAHFADGVVFSGDSLVAGMLAGADPSALRIYTFGDSGAAVAADMPPTAIEGPGFLPAALDGPYLALSHTGARVGYRAALPAPGVGLTREAFLAETATGSGPLQLTQDANFIDTIDEIGVIRFSAQGDLVFAAGERNDPVLGGLDKIDLYRATPGGTISNLTLTSGVVSAPFTAPGDLDPADGFYLEPDAQGLVLHDSQSGGTGRIVAVDLVGASMQTLADDVKSLDAIAWSGNAFVVSVRRDIGNGWRELGTVSQASGYTMIGKVPELSDFEALVAGPGGLAGARLHFGGSEWLVRIDTNLSKAQLVTPIALDFTGDLSFSATGSLRFTLDILPGIALGWSGNSQFELGFGPNASFSVLPAL